MEFLKEISIFGLSILNAKKSIRINEIEIKEVEKVLGNVVKIANKTANFINKNKLAEPISDSLLEISKLIFKLSIFIFVSALLVFIFAEGIFVNILTLIIVYIICRVLLIVSLVLVLIFSFILYTKLKK